MFNGYEDRKIKKIPVVTGIFRYHIREQMSLINVSSVVQGKPDKIHNRQVFIDMSQVIAY